MKKLNVLSLFLFIILAINSNAQNNSSNFLTYEVSEPYRVVDARSKIYFSHDNSTVSVKIDGPKVIIQKIDGTSFQETVRNEYTDFEPGFVLEQLIEMDGYAFLFYSAWDRANTREQLFVRRIDLVAAKFSGEQENLIKVQGKVTGGNGNKFIVSKSFDKSKILVRYRKYPENRNDAINKDKIGLMVLNNQLETIWSDEVTMPYTEKEMNILDYTIASDGRCLFLIDKKIDGNSNAEILVIHDGEVEQNKTEIAVEGKVLMNYGFFEGANDVLLLSGYYRNGPYYGGVDGVFNFELDNSGEVISQNMYEIPTDVLKQYRSLKSQAKMEKTEDKGSDLSMGSLRLRVLNVASDNSVTIVGEVYYTVTTTTQNGTSTKHYYEDVLVTKISSDGELMWMRKIPKRQIGTNGSGMKYIRNENNHYILFIDNIKNLVPDVNEEPATHAAGRGGFLMVNKIDDETGEVTKSSAFDLRDAKGYDLGQLSMNRIYDISGNTFGVECYIGKKQDVTIRFSVE